MVTSPPLALTAEQRAAVEAPDGPHLLAAPPGSGKTEILVQRVIWLLQQSPGELFRVLGLTYTTKAADELESRVQAALGEESWRVTATTFHSFCLDMLTHYGEPVGVPPNVAVYDAELRGYAFVDALRDAGLLPVDAGPSADTAAIRSCLTAIDRLRVDLVPPDLAPESSCLDAVSLREAYDAYDRALEAARALDFSSMLFKAYQLLVEDPWVANHYRRLYRHVLVDEAHDLNRIQYEMLRALFLDSPRNLFVVADDDQEIFTFTGASSHYVQRFTDEFAATQLPLSTNFRCARTIIDTAEQLKDSFTSARPPKPPMVPATPASGWVGAWSLEDETSEAAAVADWVQSLLIEGLPAAWLHDGEDPGLVPERVAIVGRTRYAFDRVTAELDARELQYVVQTEEGGLFDSDVGRAAYFGLRVLANPNDRVSRQRLVAHLRQGRAPAERVSEVKSAYDTPNGSNAGEFIQALAANAQLPTDLAEVLVNHSESVDDLIHGLTTARVEVGDHDRAGDVVAADADLWRRDCERLASWWKGYSALTNPADRSLSGFLRHLARLQRTGPTDPGIRLLTSHRAKGLQFRAVAVLGMNEGTFPFYRAVQEDKVDEERRALYVTITRAERGLLLTRPRSRLTSWGNVRSDPISRFVEESGVTVKEC